MSTMICTLLTVLICTILIKDNGYRNPNYI
ncbi:hypothetical protein JOC94_001659, partial [Bacillus thermophilus]|nr:hypothetical protein [Siminovitchia thermophila]